MLKLMREAMQWLLVFVIAVGLIVLVGPLLVVGIFGVWLGDVIERALKK